MPGFEKSEKLCRYGLLQTLFAEGRTMYHFPFKVVYYLLPDTFPLHTRKENQSGTFNRLLLPERQKGYQPDNDSWRFPAQCLIVVSSKRFRRAVDRNRIKRLVREAYRKNKGSFYAFLREKHLSCLVAFIYTAPGIVSFEELDLKMAGSLHKLADHIQRHHFSAFGKDTN